MPADKNDEILREMREQSREISSLSSNVIKLVRLLEQTDHLSERADRADKDERDDRHKALVRMMREMPDRLLSHIERKIYELRIARWEARKAGLENEPAPLPPPPTYREPTGKVPLPPKDDDSILPTPAQQRWLARMGERAWKYKGHLFWGSALGISHAWHWIAEAIKHALG
jgi:hypothetical protein